MATITSVSNGNWNSAATWDAGIPTINDNVIISNEVTITSNVSAASVHIASGSLIANAGMRDDPELPYQVLDVINVNIKRWMMDGILNDTRRVHLRGVRLPFFPNLIPSISCIQQGGNGLLPTSVLEFPHSPLTAGDDKRESYIMKDIQPKGMTANLANSERIASNHNVARWVSAGVSSQTVRLMWSRTSKYDYSEQLDRMTAQPFEVLLVSHTGVIKGHIQSKSPVQSEGSAFYISTITVAEGS